MIDQPGVTAVIPGAATSSRSAATSRPPRCRRSPSPSCPTSSGCTTSASARTCTTAGNRLATPPPERQHLVLRTHDAGTLRASDAGTTVTLAGWVARRRDHGGVVFLDLRDASGYVQVVVREEEAHHLRNEYCVLVTGEVRRRPEGNENPELPTGEIEVATSSLQVLSAAAPLPFPIETDQAAQRRRPLPVPLPRPAPSGAGAGDAAAQRGEPDRPRRHGRARLRRGGDADADPLDAGGRPRLRRPGAAAAGQVVRAAAVAAAVQAAADDRRARAVLPDRPLLPGRGLPGRPAAGVHPARLRDELRRPRRRAGDRRGRRPGAVARARLRTTCRRSRG